MLRVCDWSAEQWSMQLRLCMHEFFACRGIFARVFNLKGTYSLAVYFIIIIILFIIFSFSENAV